jgi:hypothetical protein
MTPVTLLGSVLAALVLAGGVVAPADGTTTSSYGHTHAADGTLRNGCHNYRYHYVVATPTNDWTLETFLVDPTGETLASGAFLSDSDPRRGHGRFRFCRYSTRAGTFTIRAKVHWYNGSEEHKAFFKNSHFRLRRPH